MAAVPTAARRAASAPKRSRQSLARRDAAARRTPTPERILDAAEARFSRWGYEATSLSDIADDVRIRTPSLYKHFGSKRELYVAVLERLLGPYFELLERLLSVPEDPDEARENLARVVREYMRSPNLARLVQHAALAEGDELSLVVERWYGPLFKRSAELSKSTPYAASMKEAMALVITFHSMMSGYVTMASLHARLSGSDPFDARAIEDQIELMGTAALQLWDTNARGSK